MLRIIIIIAVILIIIIGLIALIWHLRTRKFRPTENKILQQNQLNEDLQEAGFAYDLQSNNFYSLMDCWQREVGYCRLYDEGAPLFNMIIDCEPITFSYAGKRWLIELWKGQYGITTGGEIGIYNTSREDINTEKFKGTFYENIRDDERLPMSFVLRKNGKVLMKRKDLHWWLTGFKLGEFSNPDSLTMDAKITFPNSEMCNAFVGGLRNVGYQKKEFSVKRKTVTIHYIKPHSVQSIGRNFIQEAAVQQTNENNCRLYKLATGKYSDTLDKIEYLKAAMPELYEIFMHSLYARGLYEAFDWIREIIFGKNPKPEPPIPPEPPCPPRPCPPEPPCPPRPCPPEPPCPPRPCPPEPPCPPRPCPPEPPCPPRPCPPEPPCPPRPCPPEPPCPPRPCPPRPCPPKPCPPRPCPESCQSNSNCCCRKPCSPCCTPKWQIDCDTNTRCETGTNGNYSDRCQEENLSEKISLEYYNSSKYIGIRETENIEEYENETYQDNSWRQ